MLPDVFKLTVSRLQALVDENSGQMMDELESLVGSTSVRDLADILYAVYREISDATGIDWHFTALQWKLGNRGQEQFLDISRPAHLAVWTLPIQKEVGVSEMRYTTSLPLCLKPDWKPSCSNVARAQTSV
jgi:hypothetical protein